MMNKRLTEIEDDEIRIISAEGFNQAKGRNWRCWAYVITAAAVLVLLIIAGINIFNPADKGEVSALAPSDIVAPHDDEVLPEDFSSTVKGFTEVIDTMIEKRGLLILTPVNARPRLIIGNEMLNDSSIILAMQAADVRGDNGQIAGAFVMKGELISRGEAKAGFCSIINGKITIGVADATPMLEQALTEDGYFFRQYPLVVGGQIVENKPKGAAIRKALVEMEGGIGVVISKDKLTFHDFSQLLIDVGVRNAIYLVGSSSYGYYVNDKGMKIESGNPPTSLWENVNFIIWE